VTSYFKDDFEEGSLWQLQPPFVEAASTSREREFLKQRKRLMVLREKD
jgi:hypothetical protein